MYTSCIFSLRNFHTLYKERKRTVEFTCWNLYCSMNGILWFYRHKQYLAMFWKCTNTNKNNQPCFNTFIVRTIPMTFPNLKLFAENVKLSNYPPIVIRLVVMCLIYPSISVKAVLNTFRNDHFFKIWKSKFKLTKSHQIFPVSFIFEEHRVGFHISWNFLKFPEFT